MEFNLEKLENGLRVVTLKMPHVETATMGVLVDVGARWESEQENGLSHFLEHMAFKGTKSRSALDIAVEFDSMGGVSNAYTSHENTVYYAKVLKEDFSKGFSIVSDIVLNSIFPQEEVERERNVILQEIAMHQDSPDDLVYDFFQAACYPSQALGRTILGPEQNISAFGREDIAGYMGKHYYPSRMVVAAAGNINHEAVCAVTREAFGSLRDGGDSQVAPSVFQGGEIRKEQKLEQVHIVFGFPGLHYTHADYYALKMASTLLGGGISSRLFQEVREKRGLAYSVYSFSASYLDSGAFGIYGGTSPEKAEELVKAALGEVENLSARITGSELERAKSQIKSGIMMALESTTTEFETIGRHIMYRGGYLAPDEIIRRIESINEGDIKRVVCGMLENGKVAFSALGLQSHIPPADKLFPVRK